MSGTEWILLSSFQQMIVMDDDDDDDDDDSCCLLGRFATSHLAAQFVDNLQLAAWLSPRMAGL